MVFDVMGRNVSAASGVPNVASFLKPVAERDPYFSVIVGYATVFLTLHLGTTVRCGVWLSWFRTTTSILDEWLVVHRYGDLYHVTASSERGCEFIRHSELCPRHNLAHTPGDEGQ
jgi:hypothetical protein